MLWVYNIIINMIAFFAAVSGSSKIKSDQLWTGRLGAISKVGPVDIWIHSASVGEVKVIGHLINSLFKQKKTLRIHITTMTRSGFAAASELYKSQQISLSYFPFDTKAYVKKTFEQIEPKLLVIAETEIWPNTILTASSKGIPVILVNGRMSEKAFGRYKVARTFFSSLLNRYDRFFLKSDADLSRYSHFSIEKDSKVVAGDMKFDAPLVERTAERVEAIKRACGFETDSFLIVAGSTRPGEEEMLAEMFLKLYRDYKMVNMILAPRHLERLKEIRRMLDSKRIPYKLYGTRGNHESVLLVDKLGVLNKLYTAADLAFVGGTLVEIGGHNLLEPVWAGVPVLFGRSIYNVKESAEYIEAHNYGKQVESIDDIYESVKKMMTKEISFERKTAHDLENSATSQITSYLLKKLK